MQITSLQGKLLVATPSMDDSFFEKAVIYIAAHNEQGAMGVVINNTIEDLTYSDLFEQLDIPYSSIFCHTPVRLGGPVESEKGFVLHSYDYKIPGTRVINADFSMTSSLDILKAMASDNGPKKSLVMLGYAGWGAGQLEAEILEDSWLVISAEEQLVFDIEDVDKWLEALSTLHIETHRYSSEIGHA